MQKIENRALELVATALSEEYGIRVVCSGLRAHTRRDSNNLPVITIPLVHLHDEHYRTLIRGFVDHEVGHVRFSDMRFIETAILDEPEMSGAIKAVASLYEDIYVDRMMGECFIGCRRNLRKLALLLYARDMPDLPDTRAILQKVDAGIIKPRELPWHIWNTTLQFLIYETRSQNLKQLVPLAAQWRAALDTLAPGLASSLDAIIESLPHAGLSSTANMALARKTVEIIKNWLFSHYETDSQPWAAECLKELPWLLRNAGEARDLVDMGRLAAFELDEIIKDLGEDPEATANALRYRKGSPIWEQRLQPLSDLERQEALQAAAKMSAQMQALLQSHVLNREGPFRQGKLQTRNLHRLFIGRDDLFQRQNERRDINTEIVICIDMSGSMNFDDKAIMASKALYAVAESLSHVQGLQLFILGFYDNNIIEMHASPAPLNPRMKIVPDGGTLCGAALRAAAQTFSHNPKRRKIVIIITDGDANDPDYFKEAIETLGRDGLEILGIGIHDDHILQYLPAGECCVIQDLSDLAGSILAMLRKKMGVRV